MKPGGRVSEQTSLVGLFPGPFSFTRRIQIGRFRKLKPKKHFPKKALSTGGKTAPPTKLPPGIPARRLWWFRFCAAIVIPLVILGGLELGLRLCGYGYPTRFFLPLRINGQEYFVTNDKFGYRFFPPALARTSAPQRMAATKPHHTYRIFVFGESAAMGDPDPSFGPWRYLQTLLRERFPGTDFEVICVAMTAINSHVILPMASECAGRDGDLWIIYMGNNEMVGPFGAGTVFGSRAPGTGLVRAVLAVKTTRIGQWMAGLMQRRGAPAWTPKAWGGLNMFENHQLRHDDPNRLRAYENFKRNLEDILRAGHEAGVPIILSTVGSNLKDCAPFASLHAVNLSESQMAKWEGAYQHGIALQSAGDFQEALKLYAESAAIDPQFAELQFRLGRCDLALTNIPQALREFELARDEDTLAFRADTRINQIIKDAADAHSGQGVCFLDANRILALNSPGKIPGNELFYEHVHLNFGGNYLLGRAFAEQTAKLLPKSILEHGSNGWASSEICNRRLAVSSWDRSRVWQEILSRESEPLYGRQLTHDATLKRCEETIGELNSQVASRPPEQTRQLYQQALALAPADNFLHQNFAQFLGERGDLAQATVEAQHVCELLPQRPAQYYDIGNLLIIQGRIDEAREYFSRALAIQNDFAPALNGLGQILANQSKAKEAAACFRRALRANPDDPETYLNLGFLEQNRGSLKQASAYYKNAALLQPQGLADYFNQAVEASALGLRERAVGNYEIVIQHQPGFWQARYLAGLQLAAIGKIEAAQAQFMEVIRYRPDFAPAHLNLGVMLARQEKSAPALAEFRITLQLDPANSTAQHYIKTLSTSNGGGSEGDLKQIPANSSPQDH
jgi:tetratricopeptide (TPR) repeat protein